MRGIFIIVFSLVYNQLKLRIVVFNLPYHSQITQRSFFLAFCFKDSYLPVVRSLLFIRTPEEQPCTVNYPKKQLYKSLENSIFHHYHLYWISYYLHFLYLCCFICVCFQVRSSLPSNNSVFSPFFYTVYRAFNVCFYFLYPYLYRHIYFYLFLYLSIIER